MVNATVCKTVIHRFDSGLDLMNIRSDMPKWCKIDRRGRYDVSDILRKTQVMYNFIMFKYMPRWWSW